MAGRTFKLVEINGSAVENDGRYHLKNAKASPSVAAKKAFGEYCKKLGKNTCKKTSFAIQEITKGGGSKTYKYSGERVKLKEPKEVKYPGAKEPVLYEYENVVKKA